MFGIFKSKEKLWSQLGMDEIRKRARILVIDDSDFGYLPLFEKEGYTIEKWNDVDDLNKLESGYYDILLLDIQGVGREQSKEQGFGILKHLRGTSPAQIIITYSNAKYSMDTKYQEFFQMADATLAKSEDYVNFKSTVDDLLRDRFTLNFYLGRITTLAEPQIADNGKTRKVAEKAILSKSETTLKEYLEKNFVDAETINLIMKVTQAAILIGKVVESV